MSHLKRQKAPKNWPIKRKGTAFVARPNSNIEQSLPVLIVLRDILNLAQNRREVKKIIHAKKVLLNSKPVKDDKNSVLLFDIITIVPTKENYRLELLKTGKFTMKRIDEKEAGKKIVKIINKKTLKGKKTQINLSDGRNVLSEVKCSVGDSAVINFKDKKIEKYLPLKEKSKVIVFEGKHTGEEGIVKKIIPENKFAEVVIGKNDVNILIKQIMVIE